MSYKRNRETQKRLRKIGRWANNHYCIGVYYDEEKKRWCRYYLGSKFVKNQCNKKMRRYYKKALRTEEDFQVYDNGLYKKFSEYWWEID